MVPRTPRRSNTAGSFLTLTFSNPGASKLAQNIIDGKATVDSRKTLSAAKISTTPKRVLKPSDGVGVAHTTPSDDRKRITESTSPHFSLLEKGAPSPKHNTPSTANSAGSYGTSSQESVSEQVGHRHSKVASDGDHGTIYPDQNRRSSTASVADSVTRSSGRARKLTSKAQALAGTIYFSTAHSLSDVESQADQAENDLEDGHMSRDYSARTSATPTPTATEKLAAEAPLESVETPSIRSSTRERKPTVRAIESETEKSPRKRTSSPLAIERLSKVAKITSTTSKRSSKLRYSTAALSDTSSVHADRQDTERSGDEKAGDGTVIDRADTDQPTLETITNGNNVDDLPSHKSNDGGDQAQSQILRGNEQPDSCNLTCLSPSSYLLALARIAAEWSDSDDSEEDGDDDILLESANLPADKSTIPWTEVRRPYCQCPTNSGDPTVTQSTLALTGDAVINDNEGFKPRDGSQDGGPGSENPVKHTKKKLRSSRKTKGSPLLENVPAKSSQSSGTRQSRRLNKEAESDDQDSRIKDQLPLQLDLTEGSTEGSTKTTPNSQTATSKEVYDDLVKSQEALTIHSKSSSPRVQKMHTVVDKGDDAEATKKPHISEKKNKRRSAVSESKDEERIRTEALSSSTVEEKQAKSLGVKQVKRGVKIGKKNSAGGLVRSALQGQVDPERVAAPAALPAVPPPSGPPRSIKLRFTNSAGAKALV